MKEIPYFEKLLETLKPLNPKPMEKYRGKDISRFKKIETDILVQEMNCYEADKLDKIIMMKATILGGKLIVWASSIVPTDEYDFPVFTSEIVQAVNHVSLRTDLIPLADCARDTEYMTKYMEPMQDTWEKYKDIEGMGFERHHWFRVMLSPFYLYGKFKYDDTIEDKGVEITADYLKLFIDNCINAEKKDSKYMELLNSRKRTMFATLMEKDPGRGPLEKALGEKDADLIFSLLF